MSSLLRKLSTPLVLLLSGGGLWLGTSILLNIVRDPPAVQEGRKRKAQYQKGLISRAEYLNPAILKARLAREAEEDALSQEKARQWDEMQSPKGLSRERK